MMVTSTWFLYYFVQLKNGCLVVEGNQHGKADIEGFHIWMVNSGSNTLSFQMEKKKCFILMNEKYFKRKVLSMNIA